MKRFTTILCSIAFMVSGFLITFMKTDPQNQIHATPPTPIVLTKGALPLDLQLDLEKKERIVEKHDTLILRDTVQVVKYRTKYRAQKKSIEPDSLLTPVKTDTLYVPELKIFIQMSKDVLMDTTLIIKPDDYQLPEMQPLQGSEE